MYDVLRKHYYIIDLMKIPTITVTFSIKYKTVQSKIVSCYCNSFRYNINVIGILKSIIFDYINCNTIILCYTI